MQFRLAARITYLCLGNKRVLMAFQRSRIIRRLLNRLSELSRCGAGKLQQLRIYSFSRTRRGHLSGSLISEM